MRYRGWTAEAQMGMSWVMLGVLCRRCPNGAARAEGGDVQAGRSLGCLHRK